MHQSNRFYSNTIDLTNTHRLVLSPSHIQIDNLEKRTKHHHAVQFCQLLSKQTFYRWYLKTILMLSDNQYNHNFQENHTHHPIYL